MNLYGNVRPIRMQHTTMEHAVVGLLKLSTRTL